MNNERDFAEEGLRRKAVVSFKIELNDNYKEWLLNEQLCQKIGIKDNIKFKLEPKGIYYFPEKGEVYYSDIKSYIRDVITTELQKEYEKEGLPVYSVQVNEIKEGSIFGEIILVGGWLLCAIKDYSQCKQSLKELKEDILKIRKKIKNITWSFMKRKLEQEYGDNYWHIAILKISVEEAEHNDCRPLVNIEK